MPSSPITVLRSEWKGALGGDNNLGLVLDAYNFRARGNPESVIFPSASEIAEATWLTEKTVSGCIRKLVALGFLTAQGRPRRNVQGYAVRPPTSVTLPRSELRAAASTSVTLPGSEAATSVNLPGKLGKPTEVTARYKEEEVKEVDSEESIDHGMPPPTPRSEKRERLTLTGKAKSTDPIQRFSLTAAERQVAAAYPESARAMVRSCLARFEYEGGEEVRPDDGLVSKVLASAGGAKPDDLSDWLRNRESYARKHPGRGPTGPGWFVEVVRSHFGYPPPRKEAASSDGSGLARPESLAVGAARGGAGLPPPDYDREEFDAGLLETLAKVKAIGGNGKGHR
jgi:hypothetical protein